MPDDVNTPKRSRRPRYERSSGGSARAHAPSNPVMDDPDATIERLVHEAPLARAALERRLETDAPAMSMFRTALVYGFGQLGQGDRTNHDDKGVLDLNLLSNKQLAQLSRLVRSWMARGSVPDAEVGDDLEEDDQSDDRDGDADDGPPFTAPPEVPLGAVSTDDAVVESVTSVDASAGGEAEPDAPYEGAERCAISGHPCGTDPGVCPCDACRAWRQRVADTTPDRPTETLDESPLPNRPIRWTPI